MSPVRTPSNAAAFTVLHVGPPDVEAPVFAKADDLDWGPFEIVACQVDAAADMLARLAVDAVLVTGEWTGWTAHCAAAAILLIDDNDNDNGDDNPAQAHDQAHAHQGRAAARQDDAIAAGAQDVLSTATLLAPGGAARLRAAILRHRSARDGRPAHATDVLTGLPHEQQLVEHMSTLLALREREPAPMALLVARIEGLATTAARYGEAASAALRRKLAVRLRGAVRASDVVAAISGDAFAVLLSSIESPGDTVIVGSKLRAALGDTFSIAGNDVAVAVAIGVAGYPADGDQPRELLRHAVGLAASAMAQGRVGHANAVERAGGGALDAANDD